VRLEPRRAETRGHRLGDVARGAEARGVGDQDASGRLPIRTGPSLHGPRPVPASPLTTPVSGGGKQATPGERPPAWIRTGALPLTQNVWVHHNPPRRVGRLILAGRDHTGGLMQDRNTSSFRHRRERPPEQEPSGGTERRRGRPAGAPKRSALPCRAPRHATRR